VIFTWLAQLAVRSPRRIVVAALLFAVVAAVFGIPVSASLPAGGYEVPNSESGRAERLLNDKFGAGGMPVVFTITGPADVNSPAVRVRGQAIVDALRASGDARQVISYWTAPQAVAASMVSADRRTALVVAQIAGSDGDAPPRAHAIAQSLTGTRDDITVSAGGQAITYYDINRQSRDDLITTEIIAIPTTFIVLVWIFGSAVAALLPIAIAVLAIAGTTAALRGLFMITDVSVFAINLATALSLALAIDYALFIINRYREELSTGLPREQALIRTMSTAGRTVAYSALTVALSLAAMAVFPMYFLRSLAYAGLTSVAFCMVGALLVTPALLVILGDRIDAFDIRKPLRCLFGRPEHQSHTLTDSMFYRTAVFSMKHAVAVTLTVAAVFVLLAVPFLSLKVAFPDDRILPQSAPARQAGDLLRDEFPLNITGSVQVVLPAGAGTPSAVEHYAAGLSRVADVATVTAPTATYAGGRRIGTGSYGAASKGDAGYLTVFSTLDPVSAAGQRQLTALKHVPAPAAVLFGGIAQQNLDSVSGISANLPVVVSLIAVTTLILLFLLTGSVLLPIKALVMNALSLTVAFGAMVWIFQDGHLSGFGTTTSGHVNAAFPPLIFCIAFGLSMDYEVFVLSRVREEWMKSPRTPAANERAVAVGLARTGRIVTAAATLMAIVFLAISASEVSSMRMLGVGLTITVLVDAFVIRIILVPAAMRLMGRANWWAPAPLARWHAKWGLTEGAETENIPLVRDAIATDAHGSGEKALVALQRR
jgi:RND superfamily putative drug exporter